jgi:hypothetical protein
MDQDQLRSMAQKPAVEAMIFELEEVTKAFYDIEIDVPFLSLFLSLFPSIVSRLDFDPKAL